MTMICPSDNDLLTVEEYAERLKVSRTTVFGWLKNGLLQEGKHYFRLGRIIRFVWDTGLLLKQKKKAKVTRDFESAVSAKQRQKHTPSQPGINLDYGAPG